MKSFCSKVMGRFKKAKHIPLVEESCSEEFVPIMAPKPPVRPAVQQEKRNSVQQKHKPVEKEIKKQEPKPQQMHNQEKKKSVATENKHTQLQFDFTLYDFNGTGRVTKENIAGLVRTIYERIGTRVDMPPCGSRRIRVKLEIDDKFNNETVPIRVSFDEEQLLYETLRQQLYTPQKMDLRHSQKCDHHPRFLRTKNSTPDAAKLQRTLENLRRERVAYLNRHSSHQRSKFRDETAYHARETHACNHIRRSQFRENSQIVQRKDVRAPKPVPEVSPRYKHSSIPKTPLYVNSKMFVKADPTNHHSTSVKAVHRVYHHHHYHHFTSNVPVESEEESDGEIITYSI